MVRSGQYSEIQALRQRTGMTVKEILSLRANLPDRWPILHGCAHSWFEYNISTRCLVCSRRAQHVCFNNISPEPHESDDSIEINTLVVFSHWGCWHSLLNSDQSFQNAGVPLPSNRRHRWEVAARITIGSCCCAGRSQPLTALRQVPGAWDDLD